ncbi:MAG: DNA repair protein RadC [Ruminococcaceae bacterium]|nr:DNA repair protein RadC [Oscillospiraceae bacterium]
MPTVETIHSGHRERLKKRFLDEGLEHFSEHQVLELLLFYCIPRKDTNPIAHALLAHFGSLAQIMEASPEELQKIEGMGEGSATFLSLLNAFCRYYMVSRSSNGTVLNTIEQCGAFLMPYFYGRKNETVYLLCLDAKCKVLSCKEVGEGSVNSAAVPIRRIVEMALGANATSAVLAHNHPSGMALPSGEDQLTTKKLANALYAVDIELVDHLVIADEDYVSMRQSGYYHPDNCRLVF